MEAVSGYGAAAHNRMTWARLPSLLRLELEDMMFQLSDFLCRLHRLRGYLELGV